MAWGDARKRRLKLITFAPLSAAEMMPLAHAAAVPLPQPSCTRTGITLTPEAPPQFTPATPVLLFVNAATVPDTCVPWLTSSGAALQHGSAGTASMSTK